MAKGDFAKHIQPHIKKTECELCGHNGWTIFEEENGNEPSIIALPLGGGALPIPPPSLRCALMICTKCYHVRIHAIPQPVDTVNSSPS
jgi:hypothetical protein